MALTMSRCFLCSVKEVGRQGTKSPSKGSGVCSVLSRARRSFGDCYVLSLTNRSKRFLVDHLLFCLGVFRSKS